MKKIIGIFSIIILAIACTSKKDNFTINGTITNSQSQWIYLEELGLQNSTPCDSSKIDSKGNFSLSGATSFPSFYILRLTPHKFITLLVDSAEQINFSADYLNFVSNYNIEGSIGSEQVQFLNNKLSATNKKLDSLQTLLSFCTNNKTDKRQKEHLISEINNTYKNQEEFTKTFVNEHPFSIASVLAIYQKFNNGNFVNQDIQTLKVAASALHSMYPNSIHTQALYKETEKLVNDIRKQQVRNIIEEYGSNIPEIKLPDSKGKDILLSENLGKKATLIQFWSAFDKNSRVMNEILRENYKQFKNKGFEIYQVSIDTNKSAWLKAIKEDKLTWINVGDMDGSVVAVHNYNIQSIPANYLIDGEGNILARNIKGTEINKILNEILN